MELGGPSSENNCSPPVVEGSNVLTTGKQDPGLLAVIKLLQAKTQQQ